MSLVLFEILVGIVTITYVLLSLFFLYGFNKKEKTNECHAPAVSIIIAARNEEKNILACLESIARVDYPAEKLTVLIVDDCSEDQTATIVTRFISDKKNYRLLSTRNSDTLARGKMRAVLIGIEASHSEYVFLTDADCVVPATWVPSILSLFDDDIGLVGGPTLLDQPGQKTKLAGRIQSLDWLFLLAVARGAAVVGKPLSWVGNNLAFRRSAYEAVGGYRRLGFSLTEDFVLLRAISYETHWKVQFGFIPETIVVSKPALPLREFYRQRRRWAAGISKTPVLGLLSMITGTLAHILIPLFLLLPGTFGEACASLFAIILCDFIVIAIAGQRLNRRDLIRYFPLFEIFYFLYTTVFSMALLFDKKITWKGITYRQTAYTNID